MCSPVLVKVPLLTEGFRAELTLERSVSRMNPHVRLQVGFLGELPSTNLTAMSVSLIVRPVYPGVNFQNLHRFKALLTDFTLEVPALLMDQVMPLLQVFGGIELVAVFTLDQLVLLYQMFPAMSLDVSDGRTGVLTVLPVTLVHHLSPRVFSSPVCQVLQVAGAHQAALPALLQWRRNQQLSLRPPALASAGLLHLLHVLVFVQELIKEMFGISHLSQFLRVSLLSLWFLQPRYFRLALDDLSGLVEDHLTLTASLLRPLPVSVAPHVLHHLRLKTDTARLPGLLGVLLLPLPEQTEKFDMSVVDLLEILPAQLQLVLTEITDILGQLVSLSDLKDINIVKIFNVELLYLF